MADKVEIVNKGLILAGETKINSLTEENKKARTANIIWASVRDEVLAAGPIWNFAIKRVSLGLDSSSPVYEWDNQFSKPADCLRLVSSEEDEEYAEEDGLILANQDTLNIKYLFRQTDTSKFSPGFVNCLSTRLAVDFALQIAQNPELAETLHQLYQLRLGRAGSQDAKADTPEDPIIDDWISSREEGTYDHTRTNR